MNSVTVTERRWCLFSCITVKYFPHCLSSVFVRTTTESLQPGMFECKWLSWHINLWLLAHTVLACTCSINSSDNCPLSYTDTGGETEEETLQPPPVPEVKAPLIFPTMLYDPQLKLFYGLDGHETVRKAQACVHTYFRGDTKVHFVRSLSLKFCHVRS